MKTSLICCCGVDFDMAFAPHFVEWYARRGVESFHMILQSETDVDDATAVFRGLYDDMHLYPWIGIWSNRDKIRRMSRIVQRGTCVVADMDEFHDVADFSALRQKYDGPCVYGRFVDIFAGPPPCVAPLEPSRPILEQFPVHVRGYAKEAGVGGTQTKPIAVFGGVYEKCHGYADYRIARFKRRFKPVKIYHARWTTDRLAKSEQRCINYKVLGCVHRGASVATVAFLKGLDHG